LLVAADLGCGALFERMKKRVSPHVVLIALVALALLLIVLFWSWPLG
jgi:hypothetical protein